jgi:hypothetical protein
MRSAFLCCFFKLDRSTWPVRVGAGQNHPSDGLPSKPPFGGPEHVLRYLGAYTHRVAISNHRLVALADGNVTFRWRDSAHGNQKRLMTPAGRRVPMPLPLAPAPARLHAHPQLRLPRQPAARSALAALLPLTPKPCKDLSYPRSGPHSLTLELPGLRRNHACRRTAFPSATPASLPASPRARCMNPQPQRRIIPVLRRAQSFSVSAGPECAAAFSPASATRLQSADLALQLPPTAANSNFAHHPDLLNPIQNP